MKLSSNEIKDLIATYNQVIITTNDTVEFLNALVKVNELSEKLALIKITNS